jgi:phosphate transport system substrate-binding protein
MPRQARDLWTRTRWPACIWPVALLVVALGASGCGGRPAAAVTQGAVPAGPASNMQGAVSADGSSTVGPLMQVAAEHFGEFTPGVAVSVGVAGTGGGFERFCAGETDLSDASRAIKPEEAAACRAAGIAYSEITIANDGISVVVNPKDTWASCLTVAQLKQIWNAGSKVGNWRDLDAAYPSVPMRLYGPGTDSGTFDFFTEKINGEADVSRSDYSASEDDNVTVQGVSGEKGGLGYFGLSYYEQNKDTLKALEIDGGSGCVAPSIATVQDKSYTPLSRPLFVYVKDDSLKRPEVQAFVKYYTENAASLATTALFVPLTAEEIATEQSDLAAALTAVGA